MMATKRERMLTPVGTARYAYLKTPDITFDADGVYRTQLLIPEDECVELRERLDALAEEALAAARKMNPGKIIKLNPPYTHDVDSNGTPTGNLVFKFKKKSKWVRPNGEVVETALPAFDAQRNRINDVPAVYTGSRLRVNFTPVPYYVAAHKSAGISLFLNSYQIISLVTYSNDADYYGYEEAEGWVAAGPPPADNSGDEKFLDADLTS